MLPIRWRGAVSICVAVALVSLGLTLPTAHPAQDKKIIVVDGWDGEWSVVSLTMEGKEAPADYIKLMQMTFRGDKLTLSMLGKGKAGTFKINPAKKPAQIDIQAEGRRPSPGIYRQEKDKITICFSEGGERPTRFEAKAGTRNVLLVLKRGATRLDPAEVKQIRERLELAGQRTRSVNNLKQLALAIHCHHDVYKQMPTAAIYSKDGKPLLSWRVAILPYIEQAPLYMQFKLDEPWDSPHNKKLLAQMPQLYEPVRGKTKRPHETYYQVFTGPGAVFDGNKKINLAMIANGDGASNTIMIAEASESVPWTKPADLPYSPKKDLPKLGGMFADGFHVALCDGSVQWIRRRFEPRLLRLAITWNDGQMFNLEKLSRP